jgi:hypothetical protein
MKSITAGVLIELLHIVYLIFGFFTIFALVGNIASWKSLCIILIVVGFIFERDLYKYLENLNKSK